MEIRRRDAVVALATLGVTVGAAGGIGGGGRPPTADDDERVIAVLVAIADVVYPSELTGTQEFVETYARGRLTRSEHGAGVRAAAAEVDELAREWYDVPVVELSRADRDRLLAEIGADTAEEHPDGTTAERVRYYLVNDLLLGLFSSPTGGDLLGLENPPGFPGGTESYARGPGNGR